MSTELSAKMKKVSISPTSAFFARVEEMKRNGMDIISLNVGEPDFPTPSNIKAAGIKAIEENFTKYTEGSGIAPLRKAISKKLKEDNGLTYEMDEIAVMTGAKQALSAALMAIVSDGDEVIIPTPCYVSYPDMVSLAGGVSVLVERADDFSLDMDAIKNAVTDKTKAVIICSPDNPTGHVYSEQSIRELADLSIQKDFFVISDEIYEKIIYDQKKAFSIAGVPGMKDRTILINGFSKTYSMTGWRMGYLCARKDVIKAAIKVQSQTTTTPSSISQMASLEALEGPQDSVEAMVLEFQKRRDYVYERLNSIEGVSCKPIMGAFYALFDVSSYIGKKAADGKVLENDVELCEYLLEKEHVAAMPGSCYKAPGTLRISFASSMDVLKKALDRIENGLMLS
ncbi:pyridoxal phosphate-dependent aminotransferase [Butyrivibrio sp. NC2002]|uniref:pyridoxal phosphate-dependent aminotransferase n=1 Tax=Butyrivibrio sp. NC2002 TaxID=1410610 RepID=UPI00055C4F03|nr:pyridoxal phosphate-dependent aminotransferase [Butyrivibrio sp. NC2002]